MADNENMSGVAARKLAIEAVMRINEKGAYANILLPQLLERSNLDTRDRGFVTELVYGSTRARRACEWLVERYLHSEVDARVRATLQIGAYQLVHMGMPPHAAVSATVSAAPKRVRGLINAVLRKVASGDNVWPNPAIELSYPDWIIHQLSTDLGEADAMAALAIMNEPATVSVRDDGYVQDPASQFVVEAVDARPGELILDMCAAPGGKATGLAATGATVIAADQRYKRTKLMQSNVDKLGASTMHCVTADGNVNPYRPRSFDRVLVDAPCSGLGALRRRADARWHIDAASVGRLKAIQQDLLTQAALLVKPGGTLVYSLCTLTTAESIEVAENLKVDGLRFEPNPLGAPWRPWGTGGLILPQDQGTDGMALFSWTVTTD